VRSGYFERAINQSAYEYQEQIESKETLVVGVNAFTMDKEELPNVLKINPEIESGAIGRIRKLKSNRDASEARKSVQEIKKMAAGSENLIPCFIKAVGTKVTLGEICFALRELFGEHDLRNF